MASFKRASTNVKLVWEILVIKARKKSLYNARILFEKYDDKTISKNDIYKHILDFDWERGLWADLIWAKYSKEKFIVRVVRDNNKLHLFDKSNIFQRVKMYAYLLFLIITKKQ